MTSSIYEMTVDLNVLEHLGINLYSNIAAVLTEAVANAWDADASSVQIRVDPNSEWIEIEDDGIGMSVDDLNGKYLRVGYRRRDVIVLANLGTGAATVPYVGESLLSTGTVEVGRGRTTLLPDSAVVLQMVVEKVPVRNA